METSPSKSLVVEQLLLKQVILVMYESPFPREVVVVHVETNLLVETVVKPSTVRSLEVNVMEDLGVLVAGVPPVCLVLSGKAARLPGAE